MGSASEFLNLRNRIHKDEFRFDIPTDLWETHYISSEELGVKNVLKVVRNGELKGYAIYSPTKLKNAKAYRILEICTQDRDTFVDLINRVIEHGLKEGIDFIYLKEKEEKHDEVLKEKGFFSFTESVIMIALLNPEQFLLSMTQRMQQGKNVNLHIKDFNPICLKIGEKGVQVVRNEKPTSTLTMDSRTFLKLLFGRTSFLREFISGRIGIDNILHFQTASCLFKQLKQDKWYIPPEDWL